MHCVPKFCPTCPCSMRLLLSEHPRPQLVVPRLVKHLNLRDKKTNEENICAGRGAEHGQRDDDGDNGVPTRVT